jgi:hypothetical protein
LVELATVWDTWLSDAAKQTAYGWAAAKCAAVVLKIGTYFEKRAAYLEDKTKAKCLAKNNALKAAKAAMRVFANDAVRFNDLITPEDKLILGIGPQDTTGTPGGEICDLVNFILTTIPTDHRVIADFRVAGSDHRGKGPYHAVEVCYLRARPRRARPPGPRCRRRGVA